MSEGGLNRDKVSLRKKGKIIMSFRKSKQTIHQFTILTSPTQFVIRTATPLRKAFAETHMRLLLLDEFDELCFIFLRIILKITFSMT